MGGTLLSVPELDETVYRLRRLHGVLDRAVSNAAEALAENVHAGLLPTEWRDSLLRTASQEMADADVFDGRWSLFSDYEIEVLWEQVGRVAGGDDSVDRDKMADEIAAEMGRRKIVPEGVPDGGG